MTHYMTLVTDLEKWFAEGHTNPDLTHYTIEYLCGRDAATFSSFSCQATMTISVGGIC